MSRALILSALTCSGAVSARAVSVTDIVVGSGISSWNEKGGAASDVTTLQAAGQVTLGVRLAPDASLLLSSSGADSRRKDGSRDLELSGLGSLSSALQLGLLEDRLLIKFVATAPSGRRELDTRDLQVIEAIGRPLLGFGLRHYGTGFEGGAGASWGLVAARDWRVTVGGGGLYRGGYHLVEGEEMFRPASEWALNAGWSLVTTLRQERVPLLVDATYRGFGSDHLGDRAVFREGGQLELQARGLGDLVPYHWEGTLRGVFKSPSSALSPGAAVIAGVRANSGSSFTLVLGVDRDLGPRGLLGLGVEQDLVTGSDLFGRNGNVIGVGPHGQVRIDSRTSLDATVRYWTGRVATLSSETRQPLEGLTIELALLWSRGR